MYIVNYASSGHCFLDFDREENRRGIPYYRDGNEYAVSHRNCIKSKYKLAPEESVKLDLFLYNLHEGQFCNSYLEEVALLIKTKLKNNSSKFSLNFNKKELLRTSLLYNINERREVYELRCLEKIDRNTYLKQRENLQKNSDEICNEIKKIYDIEQD